MSSDFEMILIEICRQQQLGWLPDPTGHWFSMEAFAEWTQRAKGTLTRSRFWDRLEQHEDLKTFYRYSKHVDEKKKQDQN